MTGFVLVLAASSPFRRERRGVHRRRVRAHRDGVLARRSFARHAQGTASGERKRRRDATRLRRPDAVKLQRWHPGVLAHARAAG